MAGETIDLGFAADWLESLLEKRCWPEVGFEDSRAEMAITGSGQSE
jgi:hypothetical protein